tara:strand:- start:17101 stop:19128 length:2028 start_codon:yes stop_codon:yes gene_type:complete
MLKLKVNDKEIEVEEGLTVLQACEQAGYEIPRFCYHEKLSIAGNCRMCLVEIEKSPKPVASCAMPAAEGMNIKTNTNMVEKARKGVMEFLLVNHPLDCPVCDQGGECDLQDQSMFYGVDKSRFKENKRQVPEKYMGPLIKTQMTRCIHCTRCIRFATEVAGVTELGAIGRGENMQITTYLEKAMDSELSANVIDLCPVGALTSKPYVFEARPWELKKTESIDVMDAVGSNIRVDTYGWEVKRILPRINEDINEEWISDKTRYACDGLKNQRLDTPFIRHGDKFNKISWNEAYKVLKSRLDNIDPEKIGCFTGDLTNMETTFAAKELFNKVFKSKLIESRSDNYYVNFSEKQNYRFNSGILGIEEADLILMVGCNPRYEATILNSRIRKSYLKSKLPIYSTNDIGDQTYPYQIVENSTNLIKNIIEEKNDLSEKIINSTKPIIIIGQSVLKIKSGKYIFEELKNFLIKKNKINEEWNSLNILSKNASTVGSYDLNFFSSNNGKNHLLEKLNSNSIDLLFLLGQDKLKINREGIFVIYIGSHGDEGAKVSDLILPGSTFTEQDGYYTNLEGRIQKAFKASYPTELAKEDWQIINEISKAARGKNLYKGKDELLDNMFNYLNHNIKEEFTKTDHIFENEKIFVEDIDYYFSNVIAKNSKTMSECRTLRSNLQNTGTDG